MTCGRHIFGLPDGLLVCIRDGEGHTHEYVASTGADLSEERVEE